MTCGRSDRSSIDGGEVGFVDIAPASMGTPPASMVGDSAMTVSSIVVGSFSAFLGGLLNVKCEVVLSAGNFFEIFRELPRCLNSVVFTTNANDEINHHRRNAASTRHNANCITASLPTMPPPSGRRPRYSSKTPASRRNLHNLFFPPGG